MFHQHSIGGRPARLFSIYYIYYGYNFIVQGLLIQYIYSYSTTARQISCLYATDLLQTERAFSRYVTFRQPYFCDEN